MKKFILSIIIFLFFVKVNGQLTVDNTTMTVEQYIQNVLVGTGVTVTNIQFNGGTANIINEQVGSFNDPAANIGLTSGLILGTGNVRMAALINNTIGNNLGGNTGPGSDTDLASITTANIMDECVVEFDFVPLGDYISFKYVFASEEYEEFVCGSFNDAFGFFLSGDNPAGGTYNAQNLALIPDPANPGTFTTTPVSINTVNNGSPGANGTLATCLAADPNFATYSVFYNSNPTGGPYEYNGNTVVLVARAPVICGNTYHIKLAIGDGQDGSYDSGVFLEAGSFSSEPIELVSNFDVSTGDSVLFENCGTAFIDFIRSDASDTAVFYFNVTGSVSPADYTISADSVVFLPGESIVTLNFTANADGMAEPLEDVTIELLQMICSVLDTTLLKFYIGDYDLLVTTTPDTTVNCNSVGLPLGVDVVGPGHTTQWSTGQSTDSILVSPLVTTTYYVTVTDTCGLSSITDSVTVFVNMPPPIVISTSMDTTTFCPQDTIKIGAFATGGFGVTGYSWSPSGLTAVGDSILVSPDTTTTYVVTAQGACGVTNQDSVTINVPSFTPLFVNITTNDTTVCEGETVILDAMISGGVGTTFSWDNGLGSTLPVNVTPTVDTDYILTAQDLCGATISDTVTVSLISNFSVNIPDYTMSCLNELVTLSATISGGAGNETYLWSTGDTTLTTQVSPVVTTDYTFSITDGCSFIDDTVTVVVPIFNPLVVTVNNDLAVSCPGDPVTLFASFSGGALSSFDVMWDDSTNNFTGNSIVVNPLVTTTYTAFIIDTCAFDSATASFTVTVPDYDSLEIVTTNDTLICSGDIIDLIVVASGGDSNYTYSWNEGSSSDTIQVQMLNGERNYVVTVTDGCGTEAISDVSVEVKIPEANFTYEYLTDFTVEFTDSSFSDIISNHWTFVLPNDTTGELNPTYTYTSPGSHDVLLVVKDTAGCFDSIIKTITPPNFLYSPNAFTPDGDGLNEKFIFRGFGVESFELFIYNRWGELIYESLDINEGWDGTYKESPVPIGVYSYKVKTKSYSGRKIERTGKVTVVR